MASITKRPNGSYVIRIQAGKKISGGYASVSKVFWPSKPNLSYAALQRELDMFINSLELQMLNGDISAPNSVPGDQKRTLFEDFCKLFLEIKKSEISPGTIAFYKKIIEQHLIPTYGKMRMNEFGIRHVQDYIQFIINKGRQDFHGVGKPMSAATVKRYATVFRSILSLAYKMEYMDIDISNSRRLVFPPQYRPEVEVYNEAEVKQILSALLDEPIYIRAIIEVAFFTGCRRGEIVGLKWSDIDFENHRLFVRRSIYKPQGEKAFEKPPKTKNSLRNMVIPQRLIDTLTEYREYQQKYIKMMGDGWNNLNYVFTEIDGHVMNPQTPTKQFDHFLKRHGIRHLKFHGLRHTSATMLLANGCDIKTVSMRLGHSDLDTTNIYVHSIAESDKGAADTFDKLYTDFTEKNETEVG